jgi:hypothetical protein
MGRCQIFDINGPGLIGDMTASLAKPGVLGVTIMNYDKKWSSGSNLTLGALV